jgi:hypothetical protein
LSQVFLGCGLVVFSHKGLKSVWGIDFSKSLLGEEVSVGHKFNLSVFELVVDLELVPQKLAESCNQLLVGDEVRLVRFCRRMMLSIRPNRLKLLSQSLGILRSAALSYLLASSPLSWRQRVHQVFVFVYQMVCPAMLLALSIYFDGNVVHDCAPAS